MKRVRYADGAETCVAARPQAEQKRGNPACNEERKAKIDAVLARDTAIRRALVSALSASKKGAGSAPAPFRISPFSVRFFPGLYVVPLGISRGEVRPFVMAWKIAVRVVMLWLAVAVARQPSPSSE